MKPSIAFPHGGKVSAKLTDEGAVLRNVSGRRPLIRHGLYRPRHLPPKGKAGRDFVAAHHPPGLGGYRYLGGGRFVNRPYGVIMAASVFS